MNQLILVRTLRRLRAATLTLAIAAMAACDSEESTLLVNSPGNGGSGNTTDTGGSAGSGGDPASAGSAGSSAEPTCVEEPERPEDYLVRCTDSDCAPFDNEARLGRFEAGQPLPEVP